MNPLQQQQQQLYYVANLQYGPIMQELPDKKVAELLLQTEQRSASIQFQWMRLSQPPPGSCFLIISPAPLQAPLPDDGYYWPVVASTAESARSVSLGGDRELLVLSKERGFKAQAANTNPAPFVSKKRYFLSSVNASGSIVHSQLQFLHYVPLAPSAPQAAPRGGSVNHSAPVNSVKQRQPVARKLETSAAESYADADAFRFIGDDSDAITLRELATVRYKRNHHFLADIFSPLPATDIINDTYSKPLFTFAAVQSSPQKSDMQEFVEMQKQKKQTADAEVEAMQAKFQAEVKAFRESSKVLFGAIAEASLLNKPADIDAHIQQVSRKINMTAVPYAAVAKERPTESVASLYKHFSMKHEEISRILTDSGFPDIDASLFSFLNLSPTSEQALESPTPFKPLSRDASSVPEFTSDSTSTSNYDGAAVLKETLVSKPGKYFAQKKLSLFKTELCRAYEETGTCKFATRCIFAHGEQELKSLKRHPRYKTEVCRPFWENGTCSYGKRCCFLHVENTLDGSTFGDVEERVCRLEILGIADLESVENPHETGARSETVKKPHETSAHLAETLMPNTFKANNRRAK